jgi:hypothetical protein
MSIQRKYVNAPFVHTDPLNLTHSPALSHISTRQEHQSVLDVPGIGEVPMTWIGQVGRRRMGKVIEQEEMHPVVKGLQQDLKI